MKPLFLTPKLEGVAVFASIPALFTCATVLVFFAGCATQPESHVVSAPPPPAPTTTATAYPSAQAAPSTQTVTTTAATATAPGVVIITQTAPPAPQPEAVPPRPSSDHLWVPGYSTWRNNRYEWMAGHWEVPPRPGAKWVSPRWEPENGSYRFYEGYWSY